MGLKAWLASVSKKVVRDHGEIGEVGNGNSADLMDATISGPFCSANLSVFLIHARDSLQLSNVLTLEEALAKEHVVVQETGNVSQLKIKNVGDEVVFIQSGDIVKGGKQDRTFQFDMILPAHSDFEPINSFCVERGRWRKRGKEDATHFHASNHYLASKPLRMAAKYAKSQHEVWNAVTNMQCKSALNAHVPLSAIQDDESPTSLQLTLDNETIKATTEAYIRDLSAVADTANDVVGYAFAINGQVNSIDVYSCNSLFKKMWPKLIRAAAVEAFSELKEGEKFAPSTCTDVQACMDDAGKFQAKQQAVSGKSKTFMQESPKNVLFETRDMMNGERWVHRNYATK
jgi:hypothetical protein